MPSPVLALPCESRSTISTERSLAASAVPRLIAVVVLPTPPFWLATASTRPRPAGICSLAPDTLQPADDEDTALGVRQARLPLDPIVQPRVASVNSVSACRPLRKRQRVAGVAKRAASGRRFG